MTKIQANPKPWRPNMVIISRIISAQMTRHWIRNDSMREQAAGGGVVFEIMVMI